MTPDRELFSDTDCAVERYEQSVEKSKKRT